MFILKSLLKSCFKIDHGGEFNTYVAVHPPLSALYNKSIVGTARHGQILRQLFADPKVHVTPINLGRYLVTGNNQY